MLGQDRITETSLEYTVTVFNNDDVDVGCTAAAGSAQDSSDTNYYPATVNGAATGGCQASVDLPPFPQGIGNVGYWEFTAQRGPIAVYNDGDAGHPLDGFKYTFVQADCSTQALGADLTWKLTTLAAVFN